MKRSLLDRAGWAIAGALAIALIGALAGVVSGGPLDPPGPPASTLPLVEPRTPIRQPATAADFPIVISAPGSYYLAENITGVSGKDGIQIASDAVTLDLNGFALIGVSGSGAGIGGALRRNVSIHNGSVRLWDGGGINGDFVDSTFEDLRLLSNNTGGISTNGNSLVSRVVATNNGGYGIRIGNAYGSGGVIRDSTASGNSLDGILVLGRVLVVDNTSILNWTAQIPVVNSGSRIESNNVERLAAAPLGLAIHVESANNVIIRNSIRGVNSDVSIVPSNTVGQLENAGTPISNPWANIVY